MDVVLDTSAYSHLRRGHPKVQDIVAKAATVLLPTIVLGELEAAFQLGSRTKENVATLEEFLEEPFVSTLPVSERVVRQYGALFSELRRAGTPIPVNDVWIAATTIEAGARLLTFDSDFERVKRLDRTILLA